MRILLILLFAVFASQLTAQTDRLLLKKKFVSIGHPNPDASLQVVGLSSDYSTYSLKIFNSNLDNLFAIRNDGETILGSNNNAYGVFQFRGGLIANGTNGDFRFIVGGYNGSFGLYNNLASRYALHIGGRGDSENPTNTYVTVGGTENFASLGVIGRTSDNSTYSFGVKSSNQTNLFLLRSDGLSLFNGRVGIGDGISPADLYTYKLAVKGSIIAEGLKLEPYADWPDYVFDSTYKLPSLSSVQEFIRKNKHLPGIPSAKEIDAQRVVDVMEMNINLLKKVEEIYLYLIKKEEEILQLKNMIADLESMIKADK